MYVYCSGDEVYEVLKEELYQTAEDQYGLGEAIHLMINLEETHMKIKENMKKKLEKCLEPILHVTSIDK